ncbi:MAG: TetR/AcrR family transcriptional regulator [Actinomycetia bacterium]|nr:TetR/AcrR family transcriptional regulator [Actinomycetes bacterium]
MPSRSRRNAIIEAAYQLIAERGFEGFRIRAVADRAGLNHATVLHYFPTKQHLVEAVVAYLLHQLQQEGFDHGTQTPLEALGLELQDMRRRLAADPAFFVVLNEFQLRAYRDPAIADALRPLYAQWRQYLMGLLERGIAEGQLRADLPVDALVEVLMLQFQGLGLRVLDAGPGETLDAVMQALWALLRQGLVSDPR